MDYLNKQLLGNKKYEYEVDWGVVHPKYFEYKVSEAVGYDPSTLQFFCAKEATFDVGLWRTEVDVRMIKFITQPICLPHTFDRSDVVRSDSSIRGPR